MFGLFKKNSYPTELPPLVLFNTESKALEVFSPLEPHTVKMYSCGPTVYDYVHVGNLRAYLFADTLKRVLEYNGYEVIHTMNFTDFGHLTSDADDGDDKMMKGLRREGMDVSLASMRLLSDRFIDSFYKDSEALNLLPPTQYTRASDFVKEQIALIKTLDEKGYLYKTGDGMYFDISKFPSYGRLGNIDLEGLRSGARVEVNTEKKHPADFAVWKNGELGWESPWGVGFPGWHIECSAMAFATLGKQIDIHTGGVDNIPTHHNGEIAQCESATGKQFSKYWMHNEHLSVDGEKIAKSTGNGIIMRDIAEKGFSGLELRYLLLQSHYRAKANFSFEALTGAKQAFTRLRTQLFVEWKDEKGKLHPTYHARFYEAINNDLNTPQAIALIWEIQKDDTLTPGDKKTTILEFDAVLGLGLTDDPSDIVESMGILSLDAIPEKIKAYIEEREVARIARNWTEADRLRSAVELAGYTLKDGPEGPQVLKK